MVNSKINMKKILSGIPASPGKAVGTAKIVFEASEAFNKLKEDDILITPMTDPNYVVAMVKVKGIITDFGGILCHAALVSRELGKPCIVGTKVATQVIKQGQKILMDGGTGEIYLLDGDEV
jgi:pyruvate,water dikinase